MSETPPTWEDIAQVGDIERWVVARLRQLGLLDEATDPAKLTGAALHQYKARREEERRVRKQLRQQAWTAFRQAHLVHLGADVFHHDTPDQDRYDLPDPETRRETNALPEIKDAQALAKALDLSIPRLRWLAFHREVDSGSHYQYWTIPKRDGGARLISAPKPTLKKDSTLDLAPDCRTPAGARRRARLPTRTQHLQQCRRPRWRIHHRQTRHPPFLSHRDLAAGQGPIP
ncbi:hypothetical protein [Candidatus Competibacter phosphatis]|uniref:hypothetical protein n=1 Tax=Candidatus Competibacter phosphatis TaxID=221280 RepID=UPI0028ABD4C9|nr:hypothetical protein [Candidatus Competibacter phosphatis]